MKLQSYKELIVRQKGIELVQLVYQATADYPQTEIYGLTNQTRRSAVSIPSNIAEGSTRQHVAEYLQFLNVALGSAAELETQVLIAEKLSFLDTRRSMRIFNLNTEIMKMLYTLLRRLRGQPEMAIETNT